MTNSHIFHNLDFSQIANDPEFKEASVRSFILDPLIRQLGYSPENIVLEKTVHIRSGSKKQTVPYFADYALKIGNNFVCVLETKAPAKNIADNDCIEQAFSYASHNEIRSNYFVLCNGLELALYKTDLDRTLLLHFYLSEIDQYWQKLKRYLGKDDILTDWAGEEIDRKVSEQKRKELASKFNYRDCQLLPEIPVKKQQAKRHFGVHGYFTKQAWNVVEKYIKNFTLPGDIVLDPFGGSGITAIEAYINNRTAINVDLNPLAVFIVQTLVTPVSLTELKDAFDKVKADYLKNEPKTKDQIKAALNKYQGPKPLTLPKGSDVKTVTQLFSDKQLARLSLLKACIKKIRDKDIRNNLMLMFSGLISKINLTYHQSSGRSEGRGNTSVFAYYRYRIAPKPVDVDIMKYFELRFKKVVDAKYDIKRNLLANHKHPETTISVIKGSATNLDFIETESIDYIYTDPPYGKKIQYLDLSIMWNAWLDLDVTKNDYKLEAIEDGKLDKTKDEYKRLIAQSIKEMFRVLKYDRWLSFVFAHKDPDFWHMIVDAAESCGFEYVGSVAQNNGQTSFKKRQHSHTVLSGQLIINFRKVRNPKTLLKWNLGIDIEEIIIQTVEGVIAQKEGATLEQINDEMIMKAMELGFLDILAKEYKDITEFLSKHFSYDDKKQVYFIPHGKPFKSHIPIELRIRYYLTSLLNRNKRLGKDSHFNELVLEILPSLKNGTTPPDQTILSVLEDIAERTGNDCWRLKQKGQKEFAI
ncbi:MAG: type I restriction enzyme HsdR N-terminal domain-containing protein [Planctomycetaceae bacterium]|jgi:16S rRNA G966 N2-methylase RsmD|nr:type I restriction enzyme HsdR N-terminal domain-containing protein [Planctomycetaceae bacterium]